MSDNSDHHELHNSYHSILDPVLCSTCGAKGEPTYEEVDVGVGVIRQLTGWECPEHGGICGTCAGCGIPDKQGQRHLSWCTTSPGVTITAESFEAETDRIAANVIRRFRRT